MFNLLFFVFKCRFFVGVDFDVEKTYYWCLALNCSWIYAYFFFLHGLSNL